MKREPGVSARKYLETRNALIELAELDYEIDVALDSPVTEQVLELLDELFIERSRLSSVLYLLGVEVDVHPHYYTWLLGPR